MSNTKDLLAKLQTTFAKLDTDKWSIEELENMVELSRELHERAVILRYKAFEQKVFEQSELSPFEIESTIDKMEEFEAEDASEETFDFGIFEPEVLEEKAEAPKELKQDLFEFENQEPEVKEEPKKTVVAEEEKKEEEVEAIHNSDLAKEEEVIETPKEETAPKASTDEWDNLLNSIVRANSSSFRSPISSIAGSFGLNERLLYINELFDGDAEKFSAAIQTLDQIDEWAKCQNAIASFATYNQWDKESDTVNEFVIHIHRKHA